MDVIINVLLGDLEGASSIINELHVETYGTMDRKEKVEFILEQMRLTIANKDMVRAQIISKVRNFLFIMIHNLENLRKFQLVISKMKKKKFKN